MKNKICTLITHYNNLEGLKLSVASIEEDIPVDLIIVDDGSKHLPQDSDFDYTQGSLEIIYLKTNQGAQIAANTGLQLILSRNYSYVGRLDAGDTCLPFRFTKQVAYLEEHKETHLLGTWVNIVDENFNFQYTLKHPEDYETIQKKMYFNLMFVHPSVVFRTSVLEEVGLYPENFNVALDYAFIFNVVKKKKVENLPEILLNYVIDPNSISTQRRKRQVWNRIRVITKHFYFGYYPVVGLLRNLVLLFVSRKLSERLKRILKKKN